MNLFMMMANIAIVQNAETPLKTINIYTNNICKYKTYVNL